MYGTISHGTLRYVDLIPTFLDELIARESPFRVDLRDIELICKIRRSSSDSDLSEQELEHTGELLYELVEALNEVAPPNCYFGTHEGDGSDFGYWSIEE